MFKNQFNFNKDPHSSNRSAFTFIEVLVSVLIATIIFAAMFYGIRFGFMTLGSTRESMRATQIIVSKMESIRLCRWGTTNIATQLFDSSIVPSNFVDYYYPSGLLNTSNQGAVYNGTISITQNPTLANSPGYSTNLALVTITVTWTNTMDGHVRSRTMKTLVAQYGIQNYVVNN